MIWFSLNCQSETSCANDVIRHKMATPSFNVKLVVETVNWWGLTPGGQLSAICFLHLTSQALIRFHRQTQVEVCIVDERKTSMHYVLRFYFFVSSSFDSRTTKPPSIIITALHFMCPFSLSWLVALWAETLTFVINYHNSILCWLALN